jgi:hypothetical protein
MKNLMGRGRNVNAALVSGRLAGDRIVGQLSAAARIPA